MNIIGHPGDGSEFVNDAYHDNALAMAHANQASPRIFANIYSNIADYRLGQAVQLLKALHPTDIKLVIVGKTMGYLGGLALLQTPLIMNIRRLQYFFNLPFNALNGSESILSGKASAARVRDFCDRAINGLYADTPDCEDKKKLCQEVDKALLKQDRKILFALTQSLLQKRHEKIQALIDSKAYANMGELEEKLAESMKNVPKPDETAQKLLKICSQANEQISAQFDKPSGSVQDKLKEALEASAMALEQFALEMQKSSHARKL